MERGAFPDRRTYRLALAPLPRADPARVAHQQLVPHRPPHVGEGGLLEGPGVGVTPEDALPYVLSGYSYHGT